ncbi:DUF6776 family protein [Taylorella equigenitalis]|nr:DUF6776 family protein [Taylorella equigenitalis]WEE00218.1 hypothetical protein PZB79_06515 [Taylorella equigenitalis]WEE01695.1 hypothetical protein PZB80_06520 [Taylorella equigenitalis]WFD78232.1 DUF6776 family protein [Taylorella equigenitalis]WFD79710.1 hypothetical protein P7C94_06525 [Taylorella equigenitalis]WFD81186.1 hypothetical protein P7C86_06530 [Taylorella equigenitalis]
MLIRSLMFIFGVIAGGAAVHYYDNLNLKKEKMVLREEFEKILHQARLNMKSDYAELEETIKSLRGKLFVSDSIAQKFQAENNRLMNEISDLTKDIEFYEQLLPPGPLGLVTIRSLDVKRSGDLISYRILLSRKSVDETAFKGLLKFQAVGMLNGKNTTVDLIPARITEDNKLAVPANPKVAAKILNNPRIHSILSVDFVRWQQSTGELVLPAGFEPHEIYVKVLEGSQVRASRSVLL